MNKKKNILIVDHDDKYTGSSVSLYYILERLFSEGYTIILVTPKTRDLTSAFEKFISYFIYEETIFSLPLHFVNSKNLYSLRGIYSVFLGIKRYWKGYFFAKRVLRKYKPDLVFINEYVLPQFGAAALSMDIPAFTYMRSRFIESGFSFLNKLIARFINKSFSHFISISPVEKKHFDSILPQVKNKITIINEFVETKKEILDINCQALKDELNLPSNRVLILFIGGILEIKGSLTFLKAAEKVIDDNENACFILTGIQYKNSPQRAKYYNQCKNIIERMVSKGRIIEIPHYIDSNRYIAVSDILVSANIETHFSRPCVEAWAYKKCVVASDTLHSKELIQNYENGLMFKRNDPNDLAVKIIKIINNDDLRLSLSTAGYLKYKEDYSAERNLNKLLDIIDNYS